MRFPRLTSNLRSAKAKLVPKTHRLSRTWGDELGTPPSPMSSLFFWPLISADGGFSRAPSRFPLKTISGCTPPPHPMSALSSGLCGLSRSHRGGPHCIGCSHGGWCRTQQKSTLDSTDSPETWRGGGFTHKMGHPPIKIRGQLVTGLPCPGHLWGRVCPRKRWQKAGSSGFESTLDSPIAGWTGFHRKGVESCQ